MKQSLTSNEHGDGGGVPELHGAVLCMLMTSPELRGQPSLEHGWNRLCATFVRQCGQHNRPWPQQAVTSKPWFDLTQSCGP